jgi:hypothetical protein
MLAHTASSREPTCKEGDLLNIPTLDEGAHRPQPVTCLCVLLACQVEETLRLGSLWAADIAANMHETVLQGATNVCNASTICG